MVTDTTEVIAGMAITVTMAKVKRKKKTSRTFMPGTVKILGLIFGGALGNQT